MFHVPAHKNLSHPAGQVSNPAVVVTKVPGFTFEIQAFPGIRNDDAVKVLNAIDALHAIENGSLRGYSDRYIALRTNELRAIIAG